MKITSDSRREVILPSAAGSFSREVDVSVLTVDERPVAGPREAIAADGQLVRLFGNAGPGDLHLLATVVAVDAGIVAWLNRHRGESR